MSKNVKLEELDVSCNDLKESGIKRILHAIKLSNLTKLNISANSVDVIVIVEVLSHATKLLDLDISYNKFNNAADSTWFCSNSQKFNIFVNLIKLNINYLEFSVKLIMKLLQL